MKQNPSQGIRKYNLDDVYTPGDSNARRERIHFDFVVTDEQFRLYKAAHPGNIDVGDLILSNEDGSSGAALSPLLTGPISIFIDADTTQGDVLDFYNSRIIHGGHIFTNAVAAALQTGYDGGTLIHLYTRAPYSITKASTCGGIALHSTPEAYANIVNVSSTVGWNGVCKIGTCKVNGTYNRYSRQGWDGSSGLTIIYEKCIGGTITWEDADTSTRAKDNTVPGVVCAPWMSASVDCEIALTDGLSRKYGLYNRVEQARDLGADPTIVVNSDEGVSKLRFVAASGTGAGAYFTFEGNGRRLVIDYNDGLTWGNIGGSRGTVIISDLAINQLPSQAYNKGTGAMETYSSSAFFYREDSTMCTFGALVKGHNAGVVTYRPGINGFLTPRQDISRHFSGTAPSWYVGNSGFSFDNGEIATLDWYTWYAVSDTKTVNGGSPVHQEMWFCNPRLQLDIEGGALKEGLVYEINIHITAPPNGGPDSGNCMYSGKCASPVSKLIDGTQNDGDILGGLPQIRFCDYNVPAGSTLLVLPWGQPSGHESDVTWLQENFLTPCFHAADQYPPQSTYRGPQYGFQHELAWAKVQFVVLQGHVYIMAY